MCGLAGYVTKLNNVNESLVLFDMMEQISYRGTDNRGFMFDKLDNSKLGVGLGHNRLSILDTTSRANQPYTYKNYTLIFNGEIYNYKELQPILLSHGYEIETTSDTEVIIKLFDCFREAAIPLLNGMFAICIYDSLKEKIYLIRDRLGVKPLVYYLDDNSFLFSSEIKSFFKNSLIDNKLSINTFAIANYFKYGYINSFDSVFEGVQKVENGQIVTFDFPTFNVSKSYYWTLKNTDKDSPLIDDIEKAYTEVEELIKTSVDYRFVSDVDIGIFLSSGIDSNLILNLALNSGIKKINSFTYKNINPKINETIFPYDERVIQHDVLLTNDEVWDNYKFLCSKYDEPFADPATTGLFSLSKFANKFNKVILVGDGGDELFAGYGIYETLYYATRDNNKWDKFRSFYSFVAPFVYNIIQANIGKKHIDRIGFYHALLVNKNMDAIISTMMDQYDGLISKLIDKKSIMQISTPSFDNSLLTFLNTRTSSELVHQLNYKTDIAGMLNTIEIREPFLDYRLFEFQQKLAEGMFFDKDKNINKKYLLRRLLKKNDNRFDNINKSGFSVDLNSVFKEKKEEITDILSSYQSDFIDDDYARLLWKKYILGEIGFLIINRLLTFVFWENSLKFRL